MDYPYLPQALGMRPFPMNETMKQFGCLYLTEDSTVSFTTYFDEQLNYLPMFRGFQPIFVKELRGVTGGTAYHCHNGNGMNDFLIGDKTIL